MNELSDGGVGPDSPAESSSPALRPETKPSTLRWLGGKVSSLLVFGVLGGLLFWGHHTGWTMPKFSSLTGHGEQDESQLVQRTQRSRVAMRRVQPELAAQGESLRLVQRARGPRMPALPSRGGPDQGPSRRPRRCDWRGPKRPGAAGLAAKQQQVHAARTPHSVRLAGVRGEGGHRSRDGRDGPGDRNRHAAAARSPTTKPARPGFPPAFPARSFKPTNRWAIG